MQNQATAKARDKNSIQENDLWNEVLLSDQRNWKLTFIILAYDADFYKTNTQYTVGLNSY